MRYHNNTRVKNNYKMMASIIKMTIIGTILIGISSCIINTSGQFNDNIPVSYVEDAMDQMELNDVLKLEDKEFTKQDHSELSFGANKSKWWVRFKLEDISNNFGKKYLLFYNPTVAEVKLYLPIKNQSEHYYRVYHSGWKYANQRQDSNFFYPAFLIDEKAVEDEYVYIKISSTFSQNYDMMLLTEKQFMDYRDKRTLFIGCIFGIFGALILFNAVVFFELRDKAYLWYVIYLTTLAIYEGDLLGVFTMYMPNIYAIFMKNTISLSLIVMLASLTFAKVFFNIKVIFPDKNKYFTLIYVAIVVGLILDQMHLSTISNFYAHNLSLLGSCYIIYIGIKSLSAEYKQAKFFLVGWDTVILSLMVSLARHLGIVSNNSITVNITIIAFAVHAIFLSVAIVERMRILKEEKAKDEIRIKTAEETAKLNEIMFLQAQIKPHFLYNTLNVIASLCRIDPEQARMLILDLSQYLHHTFSYKQDDHQSSLESELNYVKAYVNIEQARFKDKINVIYDIKDVKKAIIPAMSIQPLVENAIRHGIRKGVGSGTVILRILEDDKKLRIEVEDDGIGLTSEKVELINRRVPISRGIGLSNINRRLNMLYGTSLKVESTLGKGTRFSFNIPKM